MFDQEDQVEEVTEAEEELEDEAEEVVDGNEDAETDEAESEDEGEVAEEGNEETGLVGSESDDEEDDDQSPVIRTMRERLKEQRKRIRELEAKVEITAVEPVQLGEEPTPEDFDYDNDKYKSALLEWHEKKRSIDAEKRAEAEKQKAMQKSYEDRLKSYHSAKKSFNEDDFEDAEDLVRETLSTAQQSIIVAKAKNPAKLVYELGRKPELMRYLAEQPDLASFAYELGLIEKDVKATDMNKKPAPEKRLNGRSQAPTSGQKKLEALKAEAKKTGDYTGYFAAKRKMKVN